METVEIEQLDERDIEFVDILSRYGFTENEVKVLVCINSYVSVTPKEIMQTSGLTQSAVSVAVNGLIDREYVWVAKSERRPEGKGRPSSTYSLHRSINDIINDIEQKAMQQIDTINESIERLKELSIGTVIHEDTE